MSSFALIQEYLNRCTQEPGEIEGLLPTHSSEDDDDTDSESSGESYDQESEEAEGQNDQNGE